MKFNCKFCNFKSNSDFGFLQHLKKKHEKVFSCVCARKRGPRRRFGSLEELIEHQKNCFSYKCMKKRECLNCGKKVSVKNVNTHLAKCRLEKGEFVCKVCSRSFKTRFALNVHSEQKHKHKERSKSKCLFCGEYLRRRDYLIPHLQICAEARKYGKLVETRDLEEKGHKFICFCGKMMLKKDSVEHKMNCKVWLEYKRRENRKYDCKNGDKKFGFKDFKKHLMWHRDCIYNVDSDYKTHYGIMELYHKDKVENKDYVECQICKEKGVFDIRRDQIDNHLSRVHGMKSVDYEEKYKLSSESEVYKKTVSKGFKSKCGKGSPGYKKVQKKIKDTCLKKYGVKHAMRSPSIKNKVKKTNLKKFGVDSYAKTEKFKQIQKKLAAEGKHNWLKVFPYDGRNSPEERLFDDYLPKLGFKCNELIQGNQETIDLCNRGMFEADWKHEGLKINIECDGPDHETSSHKDFDIKRDKCLSKMGWLIKRFTYDEIHQDPTQCIKEAIKVYERRAKLTLNIDIPTIIWSEWLKQFNKQKKVKAIV